MIRGEHAEAGEKFRIEAEHVAEFLCAGNHVFVSVDPVQPEEPEPVDPAL